MQAPSAPAAPDPVKTAQAQAQMNKDTAVAQYGLNATNQVTPQGTLTYRQIGKWDDGTPRFEATQAYSPQEQALADLTNQTQQNLGNIGVSQSAKIGNLLNQPVTLGNEATEARLYDLGSKRLDPRFQQEQSALETQLINKGIRPGSEAWNNAQTQFGQNKNDAYNQLLLQGRGQAIQEGLTERNQPINEITALMSGSQVSQPNFTNTPQPGVAPTDYIGAVGQSLNQQNVGYNAQLQNQQNMMSGLFGLGKTALGGWMMSSRKAKTDIEKVGKLDNGLNLYKFRYKPEFGGGLMQLGLMADEVKKVAPDATAEVMPGIDAVNYTAVAEALNGPA